MVRLEDCMKYRPWPSTLPYQFSIWVCSISDQSHHACLMIYLILVVRIKFALVSKTLNFKILVMILLAHAYNQRIYVIIYHGHSLVLWHIVWISSVLQENLYNPMQPQTASKLQGTRFTHCTRLILLQNSRWFPSSLYSKLYIDILQIYIILSALMVYFSIE